MVTTDASTNKLIILFLLEQMDCALPCETIAEICSTNNWISYIDGFLYTQKLEKDNFIYNVSDDSNKVADKKNTVYVITPDGRESLASFYINIPMSIREAITEYVKKNRNRLRIRQECSSDYYRNSDGTYTVFLRIKGAAQPLMELKFVINDKKTAQTIHRRWEDKAADVYATLYDHLVD